MALTYLTMCNELIQDVGIGTELANVASPPKGELTNVTRWIRDACQEIDKQYIDWRYLHRQHDTTLVTGSSAVPDPSGNEPVRQWDRSPGAVRYQDAAGIWQPLEFVPWIEWKDSTLWLTDQNPPMYFTAKPDNTLLVYPLPDSTYTFRAYYWRRATALLVNADEPLMPDEHRQVVIERAKIKYGIREDAPEIVAGATAELLVLEEQLRGDQLPGQRQNLMAQNDELLFMDQER